MLAAPEINGKKMKGDCVPIHLQVYGSSPPFSAMFLKGRPCMWLRVLISFQNRAFSKSKAFGLVETILFFRSCPLIRWRAKMDIKSCFLWKCIHSPLQSTLVISTSVISNNRLSPRENLVPVLTQKSKIRLQNIVEKRRNCSWGAISPLFNNISNIYF